uniref:Uncharacterized protein n=1 Tax=Moniliophthora roreri TaxID=221103 RepID=A0A0W0F438_MONRR
MASSFPGLAQPELENLLSVQNVVGNPTASLSVMFFFYGVYVALFGFSVHVLYRRAPNCHSLHKAGIITLFILIKLGVVFKTTATIRGSVIEFIAIRNQDYTPLINYVRNDILLKFNKPFMCLLAILTNFTTDFMFIHRCYVIWNFHKGIGLLFICATLLATGLGITSVITMAVAESAKRSMEIDDMVYTKGQTLFAAYIFVNVAVNLCLTMMTGGRLMWLCNEIRKMAEPDADLSQWRGWPRCKKLLTIILESGIMYPTTVLIYSVVDRSLVPRGAETAVIDLLPVVLVVAGIAPTLIIVRAKLGIAFEATLRVEDHSSYPLDYDTPSTSVGHTPSQ